MDTAQPELIMTPANGVDIAAWVWPGADPPLLFAHATGFHGRAWDVVARQLPGRRRIAVEVRGHGRSSKPEPPYLWRDFGRDIVAVAEALDVRGALGVGHSMGGHSTVCAAALRPETYSALLLIDPTIMPRELYGTAPPDASFIEKRRNVFPSAEAMVERFQNRLPFSRWHPQALRDYCEFGILERGDEFVLGVSAGDRGVDLSRVESGGIEHLSGNREDRAAGHGDPRGQDARGGRVRLEYIAYGAGSGGALSARARHGVRGLHALYTDGGAGAGSGADSRNRITVVM